MTLQLIIIGLIFLCAFIAFTSYYSNTHVFFKLVILPFTIIFSIQTAYFVYDKLGSPIETMPSGEFEYMHHRVSQGGNLIILWAIQNDRDKLYTFEYNRDNMKEMNEAKKQQGQSQEGIIMTSEDGSMRVVLTDDKIDEVVSDNQIKKETADQQREGTQRVQQGF